MEEHVLGVNLYSIRTLTQNLADVKAALKRVAAIGYKAVQISGFGPMDPRDVAAVVEDNGLTVAATHMPWPRFLNERDAVIREHKLWKCEHPAIGSLPKEYNNLDGLKRFVRELKPVLDDLEKEGLDFSYHNHSHELARWQGKTWLQRLLDEADPRLKWEIDIYWIQHGGGDPAVWLRKLAGRIPLLHIKDMAVTPEREQRFAAIGEGNMNLDSVLREARAGGVRWYLVEQDQSYGKDPIDEIAVSYRACKAMGLK
jgi:sugar phosphate isomerase/epimerase